jgi:lipoprotein-anchoring transpeptidase ErfK/SrfK
MAAKRWLYLTGWICLWHLVAFGSEPAVEIWTDKTAAEIASFFDNPGRVWLEINRIARQVTLYRGQTRVKSYPVAVGRVGWETPVGHFRVFQMVADPEWKHPVTGKIFRAGDPKNQLGQYWIGFSTKGKALVGFHGTPNPKSIGKAISHGCVRMFDKDIEELFEEIEVGTPVRVIN